MKIAHFVGHSLVRFTPGRIATMWGRYTEHEGRAFCLGRPDNWQYQEPLNPTGFYCARGSSKAPFTNWIRECDVLHFHDDSYPAQIENKYGLNFKKKILVYHAHIGNIPERYFRRGRRFKYDERVIHASITNGYGHLFDEDEKISKIERRPRRWHRLPDILDLNNPVFAEDIARRTDVHSGKLKICYTFSNNREGDKINAKRPRGHMDLMRKIRGVEFRTAYRKAIEESMALKKWAHVVLEEVFTPYLHLSALEGAAVGAMVLTNFNNYTVRDLCDAVGSPANEFPFYHVTPETFRKTIEELKVNRETVRLWGERGRKWMMKYYEPKKLLRKYLRLYAGGDQESGQRST